jgi:hypothetical protein
MEIFENLATFKNNLSSIKFERSYNGLQFEVGDIKRTIFKHEKLHSNKKTEVAVRSNDHI